MPVFLCSLALGFGASAARAQETVVTLDPAKTKVQFTLGATAHTVHGTFKVKTGRIHFDTATGNAGGEIIVDARSADTENAGRDEKMHVDVLKSEQFGEITFVPAHVRGAIASVGTSRLQVSGTLRLLSQDHGVTWEFTVQPAAGNQVVATTHFEVPYVQWGLKNPSSFLLRVDKSVDIEVHALGEIAPPPQR